MDRDGRTWFLKGMKDAVPIGLGYLKKSAAENTADGIVYEMAMAEQRQASGYGD